MPQPSTGSPQSQVSRGPSETSKQANRTLAESLQTTDDSLDRSGLRSVVPVKVKRYMQDAPTLEAGCRTIHPPAAKRLRPVL